jgi:hypothetical protein
VSSSSGRRSRAEAIDADHAASALGFGRSQRFVASALDIAIVGIVGALVAGALALALSPLMPVGPARTAEPHPGLHVDGTVVGLGMVIIVLAVTALGAVLAWRAARVATKEARADHPSAVAQALTAIGAPVPVSAGVRVALEPGKGHTAVPCDDARRRGRWRWRRSSALRVAATSSTSSHPSALRVELGRAAERRRRRRDTSPAADLSTSRRSSTVVDDSVVGHPAAGRIGSGARDRHRPARCRRPRRSRAAHTSESRSGSGRYALGLGIGDRVAVTANDGTSTGCASSAGRAAGSRYVPGSDKTALGGVPSSAPGLASWDRLRPVRATVRFLPGTSAAAQHRLVHQVRDVIAAQSPEDGPVGQRRASAT